MADQQDPYDYTQPTEPLPLPLSSYKQESAAAYPPAARSSPPPGWYPDQRSGLTRWWDGTGWTENFGAPVAPSQSAPYGSYPSQGAGPAVVFPLKQTGLAYALLIFLGGFGIHNFYLNRVGPGIAMLVMSLFGWATSIIFIGWFLIVAVWIWQIIDLFLVPTYVRTANDRAYRGLS
ncbi:MAG: hypothetical protein JWQ43_317 [Glaciihabitans sp.]|nr:hypothetical protein [Glaciihabitans sp.]